jgi:CheY-like chemotaxis protein
VVGTEALIRRARRIANLFSIRRLHCNPRVRLARKSLSHPWMNRNKTVLVVDDDPVMLKAVGSFLERHGYNVDTCSDGPMAIQKARTIRPAAVLLDLGMPSPKPSVCPIFDGYTVMGWLRSFQDTANTPVVILSASDPAEAREKALLAGACAYFQKPADPNRLLSAIRIALDE